MEPIELRGAAAAFLYNADPEVLVEGPAGTGKSRGILERVHHDAWLYPNSRQLLCRATRVSMTESILKTWEEQVLGDSHPAYSGGASRANRHSYDFPNGSTVVIGGLDTPDRLYSTEWDRIYVAEAQEVPEDTWERLGRAMRNFKMSIQQRVADVNPVHPGYWLNKRADPCDDRLRLVRTRRGYDRLQEYNLSPVAGRMKRLVSKHFDNPAYFDMAAWDWTEAGRSYVQGTLRNMQGHVGQRLFNGLWVAGEGSVYPEFSRSRHVIKPFAIPPSWWQFVGIDPGFDHPCAILWVAVSETGTLYVCNELYRGGLEIKDHARDVKHHNATARRNVRRTYGDPQHCFSQTAQAAKSIATQFRENGITVTPWPRTTNAEGMVDAVRALLSADRLKVFDTCTYTIDEFESWKYKRNAKGEKTGGDDQFEDANNHAMDVVKGLVAAGIDRTGRAGGNQTKSTEDLDDERRRRQAEGGEGH